jgi:hypothetical protein
MGFHRQVVSFFLTLISISSYILAHSPHNRPALLSSQDNWDIQIVL